MKTTAKIIGLVVLGLLLLIVGAGFTLTHLIDPNDYKDEIRQITRDKTNLELELNGDIGWSLFPWLGLQLQETRVATVSHPQLPFAEVQRLGVSVRVMPLLRREIRMSDITIDGLNLTLERDKDGRGNWENIGQSLQDAATRDPAPSETPQQPPERTTTPVRLDIDSLNVRNARISYTDAVTGKHYSAESIDLTTGAIHEDTGIPIKLSAFLGTNQPVFRAKTELSGNLRFNTRQQRYQLEDARLSGEISGESMQGKTAVYSAQGQLLLDRGAQVAEWNGLRLNINQLRALGEFKIRDLETNFQFSGGLSIAEFNLRDFLDSLGFAIPQTADTTALNRLELVTRLKGDRNHLELNDLKLGMDGSRFTGELQVTDPTRRAIAVNLKGDQLDVDRYLPAKTQQASAAASAVRKQEIKGSESAIGQGDTPLPPLPTQQAWSNNHLIPVTTLRNLDLTLALEIGELKVENLPLENTQLNLNAQSGLVDISALKGQLYGGDFTAKGTVDVRGDLPLLTLNNQVTKIPVDRLLQSRGQTPTVRGLLTLTLDIQSSGNSARDWIDHLNGSGQFELENGALLNANLEAQLCRGIATLNRKTLSRQHGGRDTPFRKLNGSLVLRNGLAHNPDLQVAIPGLQVNGTGDIDLRVLGMDYHLGLEIQGDKSSMPDPACEVNERYVGIQWPILCRGPIELGAKACRFDQGNLGKVAAQLAGNKITEKLEEKLGDKVSPELKNAIKGLFQKR